MEFKILNKDPLNILSSTSYVVQNSNQVSIDEQNIKKTVRVVQDFLLKNKDLSEAGVTVSENIDVDIQLSLIIDSINFCFWAEKDKEKWMVEWPKGAKTGGWYSLLNSFKRAASNGIDLSDTTTLSNLSIEQVSKIFLGTNNIQIPLIKQRHGNLKETGSVLNDMFDGKVQNLLEESEYDAIKLVRLVYKNFKSFQDKTKYKSKDVFFYKRAQIVAQDINLLLQKKGKALRNIDQLTAFADYKLPQIFRNLGLIKYSKDLADKIDNYVLIKKDSEEETEIRSATIWAVELIRQELEGDYLTSDIDNAIWLISQDKSGEIQPYHRTYTIYY